jgi:hypothetical protein
MRDFQDARLFCANNFITRVCPVLRLALSVASGPGKRPGSRFPAAVVDT